MYLIIGANGFLGSYIIKNILQKSTENIIATARDIDGLSNSERVMWIPIDVTKEDDIAVLQRISRENKEINVIYLAAYHKPDLVQKNPKTAWNINIVALSKVLNVLENVRCLFYSSTDSVYGESKEGHHFSETDVLRPENIYGIQKKTAEALVNGYGYNVVRFPFLIGKSIVKHKKHFCDIILETLSAGEAIEMFEDSFRSALDFNSAAELLITLIESYCGNLPKIINVSGDKDLSKYDIGLMLADKYGFDRNLVIPVSVQNNENIFEAPRATSTLLSNQLLKTTLGIEKVDISL